MPTVLITGANRGIGLELARQYKEGGWDVIATVRQESPELEQVGIAAEHLDMRDMAAVAAFGQRLDRLDLLIANAGTYGPRQPASAADADSWSEALAINTIAPFLLAQSVLPAVRASGGKLVAISTRMGSIGDNDSGGFVAYRSSKAALNMAWKCLAIDNPDVTCAVLHPGWVQTRMGGPSAPLDPAASVAGLRRVIDGLDRAQSGHFFSYDGSEIIW